MCLPMTIGELSQELYLFDPDLKLNVDITGEVGSYRGVYAHAFIGYKENSSSQSTVQELMECLDKLNGTVKEGYKGGMFKFDADTPVCFALDHRSVAGLYAYKVRRDFNGVILEVGEE